MNSIVQGLASLKASWPVVLRDIAGILAIASIALGAWLTYPPAGFIVGGMIVLGLVLASVRGAPPAA